MWAAYMLRQDEQTAGPENSKSLSDRLPIIRDGAQRERADDGVESRVRKLKRLDVSLSQVNLDREFLGPCASDLQHPGAELDGGEVHSPRIEREIAAGSNCDLEDVSLGLRTGPRPRLLE
jgi:hypothetical protein